MTTHEVERFVVERIGSWNAGDLDRLLSHYRHDVIFISPRATALTGTATVAGKNELRAYQGEAFARTSSRRFILDRFLWDSERDELVILYSNRVNGNSTRACEAFHVDECGLVDRGEALYGARG